MKMNKGLARRAQKKEDIKFFTNLKSNSNKHLEYRVRQSTQNYD